MFEYFMSSAVAEKSTDKSNDLSHRLLSYMQYMNSQYCQFMQNKKCRNFYKLVDTLLWCILLSLAHVEEQNCERIKVGPLRPGMKY